MLAPGLVHLGGVSSGILSRLGTLLPRLSWLVLALPLLVPWLPLWELCSDPILKFLAIHRNQETRSVYYKTASAKSDCIQYIPYWYHQSSECIIVSYNDFPKFWWNLSNQENSHFIYLFFYIHIYCLYKYFIYLCVLGLFQNIYLSDTSYFQFVCWTADSPVNFCQSLII